MFEEHNLQWRHSDDRWTGEKSTEFARLMKIAVVYQNDYNSFRFARIFHLIQQVSRT